MSRGHVPRLFVFLAALLIAAFAWVSFTAAPAPADPRQTPDNRPIQLRQDGYAGSDACRACHPSQYQTWHRSYHRTMTQVAAPSTVRADFSGQVAAVHGRPMRLWREGAKFFAEFDDPDADVAPGQAPRISREVVMITGSHHQQIYWYATGKDRLLGQLPGAYLIAEQRWIPRRMAVLHPPGDPVFSETGHWNAVCIACHATDGRPGLETPFGAAPIGTQHVDTRVGEFGIACEACHGPAAAHVAANRSPLRRYGLHLSGAQDPTTTQPGTLAPALSSQVCGQCHSVWEFSAPGDERLANSRGLPYRPGADLAASRFVVQPSRTADETTMSRLLDEDPNFIRDSFWADGRVRVSGREYTGLIESACFFRATEPARTLSCMSCHTMHDPPSGNLETWANDQLHDGADDDRACISCHPRLGESAAAVSGHTRHAADSSGSRCYNCHMPYTTYGLLKTIRSHTVSVPTVSESTESGRPNACNLCHLDKTLQWTDEQLRDRTAAAPSADTPSHRPLTGEEQRVSASVLWALTGDAGQRAIVAQAMGWAPAQQASGTNWMAPLLAQLLDDPYDAVRFIAARSLRSMPAYGSITYDFIAAPQVRYAAQLAVMRQWDAERAQSRAERPALLLGRDGALQVEEMLRLLKRRDDRPILLRE